MFKSPPRPLPQPSLPVDEALPELKAVLAHRSNALLIAPPGAGKTTRVPIALLDEGWTAGLRIIMLEPRRLAARAAATFMARSMGQSVGQTVGYRVRGESRVSGKTRIEVVTEGVLTRLLSADPTLADYAAVIFDEFHERSLQADLGLALTLETQQQVRPELRILVMSATIEAAPVTALLADQDGPASVVESEGRMFPVNTLYRPARRTELPDVHAARVIREAIAETVGDILVFLPGAAEQRRVADRLDDISESGDTRMALHLLHGSMSLDEQDHALAPSTVGQRKVVLATAIAESSLTVEGVRTVIDSGYSRVPVFDQNAGLTRLKTVRVSRASANQRRGRAGRVAPGTCYRLWDMAEDYALMPHASAEIVDADLSSLALELADAGIDSAADLRWIDPPRPTAMAQARELLIQLGAIDSHGRITQHGKRMAALPIAPRLAHMLISALGDGQAQLGAAMAALLEERDILHTNAGPLPSDMRLRTATISRHDDELHEHALSGARADHGRVRRVRQITKDLLSRLDASENERQSLPDDEEVGLLLARAFPDRIAQRRSGQAPRFLLRNGTGATLDKSDALQGESWLAVGALEGHPPDYRIKLAAPLSLEAVRSAFSDQIVSDAKVFWDEQQKAVRSTRREAFGALIIDEKPWRDPPEQSIVDVLIEQLSRVPLAQWPVSESAINLRQRMAFLHEHDANWPDVSDSALIQRLDSWLAPSLTGVRRWSELESLEWAEAIASLMTWQQRADLDRLAPTHLTVPSGSRIRLDYSDSDSPVLAVKLQECFGMMVTPAIMDGAVPVTLHLLSPAQRPVQITRDLAGFWRSGYFEVRRELRGRYPRHPWPENPLEATPTRRTRPRGL